MPRLKNDGELDSLIGALARQIADAAPRDADIALVGIHRRGVPIARRLAPKLEELGRKPDFLGELDITLYRDDLSTVAPHAVLKRTWIDFDVTTAWIVLVDDVLYTGRSVRAAIDGVMDLGRPKAIRLAVLVDRGWRELPIQADFIGMVQETTADNIIKVKLAEIDGEDAIDMV